MLVMLFQTYDNLLSCFGYKFLQAGFLDGITNIVPGIIHVLSKLTEIGNCSRPVVPCSVIKTPHVFPTALGGVNIKQLLNEATDEMGGKLLLDFNDTIGDRIQVFLE